MSSAPPPQDAISSIIEILGLSPQQATVLLRNNNNDVSRCMEAYFADPSGSLVPQNNQSSATLSEANLRAQQQQQHFNERRWDHAQDNIPFDNVHGHHDEDARSTGAMPALSRPPSRADGRLHQGRHNGGDTQMGSYVNPIDMSTTHAQATALADGNMADEDPELQAAIKMSLQEGQQEDGVVPVAPQTEHGQHFGPAAQNRDYNPAEWGMVQLPVATSRELFDHPPPSKRRRINGQPAFLRPTADTEYLAALLTIYHSIPLAREALLLPAMKVSSYGYDPSWWSGSADANSRSISIQTSGDYHDTNKANALAEVQCLMAFLDNTTRGYGSVDALADLHAIRAHQQSSNTSFSLFLEAWRDAALSQQPEEPLSDIFRSEAKKCLEPGNDVSKAMVCVEAQVYPQEGQTLVALLDSTVWDDSNNEPLQDVWISHAGEVFTIRVLDTDRSHHEGLLLDVPAVWYPDRYMATLREQTRQMRTEVQEIQQKMYAISQQQRRLESFMGPNRKPIRAKEVLEATAKAAQNIFNDRYAEHQPNEELNMTGVAAIEGQIRAVLARIDEKVQELEDKKKVLQREIDQLQLTFTGPGDDPSQPPNSKYILSGVATKPEIMYIRERNADLLGLDDDDTAGIEHSDWKWWRIAWSPTAAASAPTVGPMSEAQAQAQARASLQQAENAANKLPYDITEVSEADVIEAVRTEHYSAVLIYASEKALNSPSSPLPPALKQYVEQDNITFNKELREEMDGTQGIRADSDDSGFGSVADSSSVLDSNIMDEAPDATTASAASTTTTASTVIGFDREMTPMSISSTSYRGEDGQPSPKRPKSSDNEAGWSALGNGGSSDGLPPPYEDSVPEMTEVEAPVEKRQYDHQNKIGKYADVLMERMERYGNEDAEGSSTSHVERVRELPR